MKKKVAALLLIMVILSTIVVSAELPLYDYSSFVGSWMNNDFSWKTSYSMMIDELVIHSVNANEISFSIIERAEGTEVVYQTCYINNNQVKWIDYDWSGKQRPVHILTFNADSISYTEEGSDKVIYFTSDNIKPRRIRKDHYDSWSDERIAHIEYYYENGMYYEARDELAWLNSSGNRSLWNQTKIDELNEEINYLIEVMDYVHGKLSLIKSYLNQGLYYEAKDELNWLKAGYILGPVEEKLWGEYELDAGLGTYKLEHKNELQQERLKDYMWTHFEKTPLRMQADIRKDITTDLTFVSATQDIRKYEFADVDNDGSVELIIISNPIISEYYGDCFSIWDCRENGDVYCVLAKCGQNGRERYLYNIIEYNGENFLLELANLNGFYNLRVRNVYRISNGMVIPCERMYGEYEGKGYINGKSVSPEYAIQYIDDYFDNSYDVIVGWA